MFFFCPRIQARLPNCTHLSSLDSSHLWQLLSHLSLCFMTLTFLESMGQAFRRMSLSVGFSSVFSSLDWRYGFWGRAPQRGCALLTASYWGGVHDSHTPSRWRQPWPLVWFRWCLPESSIVKIVYSLFILCWKWVTESGPQSRTGQWNFTSSSRGLF